MMSFDGQKQNKILQYLNGSNIHDSQIFIRK